MATVIEEERGRQGTTWLGRAWFRIKLIYLFLLPTRFGLLAVVLVGWAFMMSDQGLDILRALVEYDPCKKIYPHILRMLAFVLAANAFSYQMWYWTRQILRVKPPEPVAEDKFFPYPPPPEAFPRTAIWFPRILGALGFVIPFIAFFRIGLSYFDAPAEVKFSVGWMFFWLALSLAVFFFVVRRRRTFLRRRGDSPLAQRDPRDFARSTKIVLIATLVAEAIFFLWATVDPVSITPLGSGSLVLLTAALWVPLGTFLVLVGIRLRFPIMSALLVWALLWSRAADGNHIIRTIDESGAGPVDKRLDAVQQLDAWYKRVAPLHAKPDSGSRDPRSARDGRIPIFVVATEGGGIRAAYWTAAVLTAIQDSYPEFDDHLFAVSGVSGGSLGAAVFNAVLAHGWAPADPYEKACPRRDEKKMEKERETLRYAAKKVLSFDALTPALAGMTQPDLAQRFLPFRFPDREKALEEGWERGWSRTMQGDPLFSGGILSALQARPHLPSLFFNGTMVETGDRIITSNCRIHPRQPDTTCATPAQRAGDNPLCEFRNAFDSFADLRKDIPFSAAAGMSARFTYISPAGRLPNKGSGDDIAGHVVDGGYFENSGAVTAAEIVGLIGRIAAQRGWKLDPYVILIDSEDASKLCKKNRQACKPDRTKRPFQAKPDADGPAPKKPERWLNEILSPLRALLNTRGARGSQAVGDVRELLAARLGQRYEVIEFRLIQRRVPLPLGWLLSEHSRIAIDRATRTEGGNVWALERIGGLLREPLQADPVAQSAEASAIELQ